MSDVPPKVLVLDAMGVIYRVGDDVADLLVPFIRESGGVDDAALIESAYIEASLGQIATSEFWHRVGLSNACEDDYLQRLELTDDVLQVLESARGQFDEIACLSNDVSEWSKKLRERFNLEQYISRWYISGDLQARKPSLEIYRQMLDDLKRQPANVLFVDDRPKNLHAAAELGMQTVCFDPAGVGNSGGHRTVASLFELV